MKSPSKEFLNRDFNKNQSEDILQILLIDDEPFFLEIVSQKIKDKVQCNITLCPSGDEAIERIKSKSFDLIICDFMMPDGDGLSVYQFLHMLYKHEPPDFVFFSSYTSIPVLDGKNYLGIVEKPNINDLISLINQSYF